MNKNRVPGIIYDARKSYDYPVDVTINIGCKIDGYCQTFGGLALDERLAEDYTRDLCATFGVERLADLVNKPCFALYSFADHRLNRDGFDGLESAETGKRFIHNVWRRKNNLQITNPFIEKQERLLHIINNARRTIEETHAKLAGLADDYVDWERV